MGNSIQIERKNLGKSGDYFTLVLYSLIFFIGFLSIFWEWKSGIVSVICVIASYFLNRKINLIVHLKWFSIALVLLALLVSWLLQLSFWIFIIQFLALSCIHAVIAFIAAIRDDHTDIIFSLNADNFSCLCPGSDYKGYALNPMGYRKYFKTKDIDSIQQDERGLLIVVKGEILRPRELTASEITQILAYFNAGEAKVVEAIPLRDTRQAETELAWVKILVFGVPCLLAGLSIYFLGDNGQNTVVSMISILLAILLVPLLLKLVNRRKHRPENK
ncbi:hypothetical protein [Sphingobacterium detergens]|uniref:Uncharacterized protein n=1 Tax=Sphingobacterium detergens TaxID=1145106 RepID=A0A420BHH6_SPHD1|nr:hypothetical protein [Sphingobacterium detergens]RKE56204.1 hypothetical protein DFQ12_1057 [Sphingobacterium detergens]